MADATARTLSLLSLFQSRRHWTGNELADRLGVSERTVRRDVVRLRDLGYPVEAVPGIAGGYRLIAGTDLPPLLFGDDEAVALAIGLRAAAGAAVEGADLSTVGVMAKLEQMLPDRLRRRVEAVHANIEVLRPAPDAEPVPASSLATIAQGCRDREELRFDYRRRDGEESRRLVRPHQVVSVGGRWYLVGWDVRRSDWRTFRVDRMGPPALAGATFAPMSLPAHDAATFVTRSLAAASRVHRATVVVAGPATEVAAMANWLAAHVERPVPVADGWARLELRSESLTWLAAMVAILATSFELRVEHAPDEIGTILERTTDRLGRAAAARR